jgi:F0F1-type ATP synthase epsilon subunit
VTSGYHRVDPAGAVEILVEKAVAAKYIDSDAAKNELKTAETELAKWGDKAQDGEYTNLSQRAGWARARIDAASH